MKRTANTPCYQLKYIRCGRNCQKCPHGPYWYEAVKVRGRVKWKYLGKERPDGAPAEVNPVHIGSRPHQVDQPAELPELPPMPELFSPRPPVPTMGVHDACELLGIDLAAGEPRRERVRQRHWNRYHRKSATAAYRALLDQALALLDREWYGRS